MCACNTGSGVGEQLFSCFRADLEQYKCTRCDSFRTHFLHVLKRHLKLNHTVRNEEFQLYRCEKCSFETWSKYLMIRHRKFSICVVDKRKCVIVADIVERKSKHNDNSKKKLSIIGEAEVEEVEINDVKVETRNPNILCIKHDHCYNIEQSDFSGEKFHCMYCSYTTESKQSLKSHKCDCFKFQCGYCPYSSPYKSVLGSHIKFVHTNQFKCRFFPNSKSIASILQTEHDHCYYKKNGQLNDCNIEQPYEEKPMLMPDIKQKQCMTRHQDVPLDPSLIKWFHCPDCPFKTKWDWCLMKHRYKHSSVKPEQFECKNCTFKTRYHNCLLNHQKFMHMNPTLIEWFKCQHCSYRSKYRHGLKVHEQRKHFNSEKFQCKYCSFEAFYKNSLKIHELYKHFTCA